MPTVHFDCISQHAVRQGGAWSGGGCLLPGGSAPGGAWSGEMPAPGAGVASQHALRQTPLLTESQTPVKTLPCPNFVAGGNKVK